MGTTPAEKYRELLEGFDMAMLVTRTDDGDLRGRPMAVADLDEDGSLWFLTQRDAPKIDEIAHDSHVGVVMQGDFKYISISGKAKTVEDRAKVAELWSEGWKTWFPGGKDDPKLQLLKVEPNAGEYWDNSWSSGIKYLFKAGKAFLTGTRPDVEGDPKIHGKVRA